jgi:hypothetical protein
MRAIYAFIILVLLQPAAPPQTTPLKVYWSERRGDNFSTTSAEDEAAARDAGYQFGDVEGALLAQPAPGTVPLKLFWNAEREDNFSSATAVGEQEALAVGYTFVRVQGYVFTGEHPGTVPLLLFWSAARGDNFTTATAAGAEAARSVGYEFVRIEGYIYPTRTTDPRPSPPPRPGPGVTEPARITIPGNAFSQGPVGKRLQIIGRPGGRAFRGQAFQAATLMAIIPVPSERESRSVLHRLVVRFRSGVAGPSLRGVTVRGYRMSTDVRGDYTTREVTTANTWVWRDPTSIPPQSEIRLEIQFPGGVDSAVNPGEFLLTGVTVDLSRRPIR